MNVRIKKCAVFMVGLLAIWTFFCNANIPNAFAKTYVDTTPFQVNSVEYVGSHAVKVTGWFYNTSEKDVIVSVIQSNIKAYDEDGELIFKAQGRMHKIQPVYVPVGSQSDFCSFVIGDERIKYYDGEVDWHCSISVAATGGGRRRL